MKSKPDKKEVLTLTNTYSTKLSRRKPKLKFPETETVKYSQDVLVPTWARKAATSLVPKKVELM